MFTLNVLIFNFWHLIHVKINPLCWLVASLELLGPFSDYLVFFPEMETAGGMLGRVGLKHWSSGAWG